jgi:hypothetical protein
MTFGNIRRSDMLGTYEGWKGVEKGGNTRLTIREDMKEGKMGEKKLGGKIWEALRR